MMNINEKQIQLGNRFINYYDEEFSWRFEDFELINLGCDFDEIVKNGIILNWEVLNRFGWGWFMSNPRLENFYDNKQTYVPFILKEDREGRFFWNDVEIEYLHELQNLFFIVTKEELKEIEL